MKSNYFLLNTAGIIYGLVVINAIVLAVSHFLSTGQNIPAMFTAAIGSFIAFMLSQLLPLPVLKRRWVMGLIIGFIGSFITALVYTNYKTADLDFEGKTIKNGLTVSEASSLKSSDLFQLDKSKTRILDNQSGTVYEDDVKGNPEPYVVIPVVDAGWKAGDTVKVWAAYNLRGEMLGKREEDYTAQLHAASVTAIPVTKGYYYDTYSKAVKETIKQKGFRAAGDPRIYEFVDREMETAFWKKRVTGVWMGVNGLWLLFTLPLIGAKPKPKDAVPEEEKNGEALKL